MSTANLDRFLSAASDFDASDLHLVAGVPPAFRVNGEIIIADEDALSEAELESIVARLLNEQQKKKFEQEWELCISMLHSAAGRGGGAVSTGNRHHGHWLHFFVDGQQQRAEVVLQQKY